MATVLHLTALEHLWKEPALMMAKQPRLTAQEQHLTARVLCLPALGHSKATILHLMALKQRIAKEHPR